MPLKKKCLQGKNVCQRLRKIPKKVQQQQKKSTERYLAADEVDQYMVREEIELFRDAFCCVCVLLFCFGENVLGKKENIHQHQQQ